MKATIKSSVLRIVTLKRLLGVVALLILCVILTTQSCTTRNVQEYALETVSREFEPFVTPLNEQLAQEEQLNTRLLYAAYITLFDNWKYQNSDELKKRLISCFYENTEGQNTNIADSEEIFNRVQGTFGLVIDAAQRRKMLVLSKTLAAGYIDSGTVLRRNLDLGNGAKTNIGLTNFAWNALHCRSGYVFGAVGQPINTPFLKTQQRRFAGNERANLTESEVASIFINFGGRPGFDCIGLIKAYSWMDEATGMISPNNKNAMEDCNANGLFEIAAVKGNISAMPDTPGLAVQKDGHVGIYIGGGEVIEARGNRLGVAKTKLKGRGWVHYMQVPTLTYVQSGTYSIHDKQVVISGGKIVDSVTSAQGID